MVRILRHETCDICGLRTVPLYWATRLNGTTGHPVMLPCPNCGGPRHWSRGDDHDRLCSQCRNPFPTSEWRGHFAEFLVAVESEQNPGRLADGPVILELLAKLYDLGRNYTGSHEQNLELIRHLEGLLDSELGADRLARMQLKLSEVKNLLRKKVETSFARTTPKWDSDRGELTYKGKLVRKVSPQAANIRVVLDAFEESNWKSHVKAPFPDGKDQLKLNYTIRSMNSERKELEFSGRGDGESVCWKVLEEN